MNKKARSIDKRMDHIESVLVAKDGPIRIVRQSLDDPDLFYLDGRPDELMTEKDAIDKLQDCTVIIVRYVNDWKDRSQL